MVTRTSLVDAYAVVNAIDKTEADPVQDKAKCIEVRIMFDGSSVDRMDEIGEAINEALSQRGISMSEQMQIRPVWDAPAIAGTSRSSGSAHDDSEALQLQWARDHVLVSGHTVAKEWGVKREEVDAAAERGEIFSIHGRAGTLYPAVALKLTRGDLELILRALGDEPPTSKLMFLLRPHGALGGRRVTEAVDHGQLSDVLRIAEEWTKT